MQRHAFQTHQQNRTYQGLYVRYYKQRSHHTGQYKERKRVKNDPNFTQTTYQPQAIQSS